MKEELTKTESGNYDKLLYKRLESFVGKRCKLILRDGRQPEGNLNYISTNPQGPFIIFDMGDFKVSQQYNLEFYNILGAEEIK